jgi:hypothetical protein
VAELTVYEVVPELVGIDGEVLLELVLVLPDEVVPELVPPDVLVVEVVLPPEVEVLEVVVPPEVEVVLPDELASVVDLPEASHVAAPS